MWVFRFCVMCVKVECMVLYGEIVCFGDGVLVFFDFWIVKFFDLVIVDINNVIVVFVMVDFENCFV